MSDLTVSTPIDTFMQATTQVGAAGALGFTTTTGQTYTLPTTTATLARTDLGQTFTGANIFTANISSAYQELKIENTAATGYAQLSFSTNLASVNKTANVNWFPGTFLALVSPDTTPVLVTVNGSTVATFASGGGVTLAGNLTFGTSASVLSGTTGSIGLTATGTNQSITLTPSGTGQVILANGSAAKPGLVFSGGTTTGFYSTGDGSIKVSAAGILGGYFGRNSAGGGLTMTGVGTDSGVYVLNHLLLGGLTTDGGGNKVLQLPGLTGVLNIGATANATIGVSADTTAGVLTFTAPSAGSFSFTGGQVAIANTVQAAVAVASTHKVTMVIGGVTYYLLATNVP